jgi:hypothetical protein
MKIRLLVLLLSTLLLTGQYGPYRNATLTIANGASLSDAHAPGGWLPVAIAMPAAFTGVLMTFQLSADCTTYQNLYDDGGNEYQVAVAASRHVSLDGAMFKSAVCIKARSGTAGAPTAEAGERVLMVILKNVW